MFAPAAVQLEANWRAGAASVSSLGACVNLALGRQVHQRHTGIVVESTAPSTYLHVLSLLALLTHSIPRYFT